MNDLSLLRPGAVTAECMTLRLRRMGWEAPGVLSLEFTDPDGGLLPAIPRTA